MFWIILMRKFVIIIPRAFVTYGFINYFDRIACRDLLFTRHLHTRIYANNDDVLLFRLS